jgi:hypothetical protein
MVLAMAAVALFSGHRLVTGCGDLPDDLTSQAENAISENPRLASRAIQRLRDAGPKGLEALLDFYQEDLRRHALVSPSIAGSISAAAKPAGSVTAKAATSTAAALTSDSDELQWQRLRTALDQVSGQHDCHTSRLYWYTDLEIAKSAAHREGKPILSLRLLGKLTDEYSCANSRFFRATLYSNPAISQALRQRFVLHWQSVRPAPKVTIDFGDGRKLQRTITGNSIHYVLDSEGRVLDALPGLYGPQAFLRELQRDADTADKLAKVPGDLREKTLQEFHRDRAAAIESAWRQDLQKLGLTDPAADKLTVVNPKANYAGGNRYTARAAAQTQAARTQAAPTAAAGKFAASKGFVEMPLVRSIAFSSSDQFTQSTTDEVWNRIAQLHSAEAKLDPASVALIRSQNPNAAQAAPRAYSKRVVESPLVRMVRNLQGTIALDTVRNEYLFHLAIHRWLAAAPTPTLDALNDRVYAELFLTPNSDPWLGLMPADTYSALDNNGIQ